jgi:hypothetical protein
MRELKTYFVFIGFILSAGCASTSKCQDEVSEPVSICRAKKDCGYGAKAALAVAFGGSNVRNKYESCVDEKIGEQKSKAGIRSESSSCTTRKIDEGVYKTICN